MVRHSKTAFTLGPELRARLRQLREKKGLTLRTMALLMDRHSSGAHAQLSRLERGKMPYPTFNFVIDYLHACGARVEDLADLLDPYLSKPPVLTQKGDAAVAELLKALPKAQQRAMNDVRTNDERKWVDKPRWLPIIMCSGGVMKFASAMSAFGLCLLLVGVAPGADSLNVRFVGSCDTPGYAFDLALDGEHAFVADGDGGLCVISVADPARPVEVGHLDTPHYAHGAAVTGDYVCVADGVIQIISVVDPTQPIEVGRCLTDDGDAVGVAVSGDYAYVADGWSGFSVVSIREPSNPVETGRCDLPGGAYGVAVSGDYAFVSANGDGLRVITIADPARPAVVACCSMFMCLNVALKGTYALVTNDDGFLRAVDVSAPTHPVEVGSESTPGSLWGVAVSGAYAFVGGDIAGLRVISIADPRHPYEVGYYDTPGNVMGVKVAGDYVYVCDGGSGFEVYQFYGGGVEESPRTPAPSRKLEPTVLSGSGVQSLKSKVIFDAMGRRVANPRSGVYFVREEPQATSLKPQARTIRKVVITG